jgi:uncharacterized protein (TIGR00288 family)
MSSNQPRFGPPVGYPGGTAWHRGPNAALLIDFDNVTMGVRSDLGKELKMLLNSDIFHGDIAVRRAYADWRRYPNYVVPLSESSVDLIFAPAYGTSKKNATDLRMAVDAIELAFMRPEIGTFILLTGDSDFTSCVVKLKEYGKYVIGVGMRESSSDLLIQNCDEYYSYHALSGLTRTTVGEEAKEDPWLLVKKAAKEMAKSNDAMRTDRLKQVMIEMDPGFDEKNLGYSKFSRFVSDAAGKGLIRLKKVENGQYEIMPADETPYAAERGEAYRERDRERDHEHERGDRSERGERDRGRGGRGRGRFGRDRERPRGDEPALHAPRVSEEHHEEEAFAEAPAAPQAHERPAPTPAPASQAAPAEHGTVQTVSSVEGAYGLLQQAVRGMVGGRIGQTVRDGDVKRKMLDLAPGFDEGALGFSKFSRFLRAAHDAEAIDLRRLGEGSYEVALPASGTKLPPPVLVATEARAPQAHAADHAEPAALSPETAQTEAQREERGGRGRGRRGRGRGRGEEGAPSILPGQAVATEHEAEAPREEEAPAAAAPSVEAPEAPASRPAAPAAAPSPSAGAAPVPTGLRGRRGPRGRGMAPEGPPPLLPGQAVPSSRLTPPAPQQVAEEQPAAEAQPEPQPAEAVDAGGETEAAREEARRGRRGRGRGRRGGARAEGGEAPATDAAEAEAAPPPSDGAQPAVEQAVSAEATGATADFGLPSEPQAIEDYITTRYHGVGRRTAQSLVQAFGPRVFDAMEEDPDSVRSLLGRRANALLQQWGEDRDQRAAIAAAEEPAAEVQPEAATPEAPAAEASPDLLSEEDLALVEPDGETPARRRSRGRRGGRGRGRGAAGEAEVIAPAATPEVEHSPEAEPAAPAAEESAIATDEDRQPEAAEPAAEETPARPAKKAAKRGRGRGGRAGQPSAEEQPAVEQPAAEAAPAEPEPQPEPAAEAAPAEAAPARAPRKRGPRKAAAATPAPEAPAPEPTPAPEARAPRKQGARKSARAATPAAEPTTAHEPAPEEVPAAEDRPRARRGGRGRGRGGAGGDNAG